MGAEGIYDYGGYDNDDEGSLWCPPRRSNPLYYHREYKGLPIIAETEKALLLLCRGNHKEGMSLWVPKSLIYRFKQDKKYSTDERMSCSYRGRFYGWIHMSFDPINANIRVATQDAFENIDKLLKNKNGGRNGS